MTARRSKLRRQLDEYASNADVSLLLLEGTGFDAAIVGVVEWFGPTGHQTAVLYDEAKLLAALVQEGLSAEDAREHMDFNVRGAYVGEHTPVFLVWRPEK